MYFSGHYENIVFDILLLQITNKSDPNPALVHLPKFVFTLDSRWRLKKLPKLGFINFWVDKVHLCYGAYGTLTFGETSILKCSKSRLMSSVT